MSPSQLPVPAVGVRSCAGKASDCFLLGQRGEGSPATHAGTVDKLLQQCSQPGRKPPSEGISS